MCKAILNSTPEQKAKYLEGMAKSIPHKVELIAPWIKPGSIVDLGCADASFTSWLSLKGDTTGIDISPEIVNEARDKYVTTKFRVADVRSYDIPSDNVIASSILHEVFSYGNGIADVDLALRNIHANLNAGGRLIIRDFVRPYPDLIVDFWHKLDDMKVGHAFNDFMVRNKRHYPSFRALAAGFQIYSGVPLSDVYEYIFHKDFHANWETEIKETYGFWDFEQAKAMLADAGFKIVHAAEIDNTWILANRIEGKVKLQFHGTHVSIPKYQALFVVEKM